MGKRFIGAFGAASRAAKGEPVEFTMCDERFFLKQSIDGFALMDFMASMPSEVDDDEDNIDLGFFTGLTEFFATCFKSKRDYAHFRKVVADNDVDIPEIFKLIMKVIEEYTGKTQGLSSDLSDGQSTTTNNGDGTLGELTPVEDVKVTELLASRKPSKRANQRRGSAR